MADRGEKLQQPHCNHPFSDSRDTYLAKNHYKNYSPKMVPTNPTGSWTIYLDMLILRVESKTYFKLHHITARALRCANSKGNMSTMQWEIECSDTCNYSRILKSDLLNNWSQQINTRTICKSNRAD